MSYITVRRNGKKRAVNLDKKKRSYIPTKVLKAADLKKIHIHGLSLAGYALDLADGLRKKALEKAVTKYGKGDTMAELSLLRTKYQGNERMERVIDSDIAYVATGKFEEA
jgi:hypothetical protein